MISRWQLGERSRNPEQPESALDAVPCGTGDPLVPVARGPSR